MSTTDWKRKLAAYLHDPPSKALDIPTYGERSDAASSQARQGGVMIPNGVLSQ